MVFDDLSPGYAAIVGVTEPLVALLVIALLARGIPRVLFIAQLVYWSLSYIARPILLLQVRPVPAFGDSIADTRVANTGYDYNISHILPTVTWSLWIYVAMVFVFVLWQRTRPTEVMLPIQSRNTIATLGATWAITSLVRLYAYFAGQPGRAGEITSAHPYIQFFTDMGSLAAIGLILYFHSSRLPVLVLVFTFAAGGELLWGIATESKTPFLGAVLAAVIRMSAGRVSRGRVAAIVGASIGAIALFSSLQSVKEDANTAILTAGADRSYPLAVQPFLSILRRFDLFASATDVYFLDGRPYIGSGDVLSRMFLNLVPQQLGIQKIQSGTEWANMVRGSSVDMSGVQVSLAEGHFAEGYAVAGYLGVAAESLFVIAMIVLVGKSLASRFLPFIMLGLVFISLPPLFERGALGITETLGKGLQAVAAVSALGVVVWFFSRRSEEPPVLDFPDADSSSAQLINMEREDLR